MQKHLALILAVSTGLLAACDSNSSSQKNPAPSGTTVPDANASKDPASNSGNGTGNGTTTVTDGGTTSPTTNPTEEPVKTPGETPTETGTGSGTETPPENPSKPDEKPITNPNAFKSGLSLTRSTLLSDLGNGIAKKAEVFHKSAADLQAATALYCGAIGADPTAKTKAQEAWKNTILLWEQFELFQVGPLAENNKALKFGIYGWPLAANLCQIDAEAMNAGNPGYALPVQFNRKGLQAMEYLLFEKDLASSCSKANPVYTNWTKLSLPAREQARCNYLQPLALELLSNAESLKTKWGVVGNNVLTQAVGNEALEQAAIQALYENLFYTDIEFKNSKLAAVAGHDVKYCAKTPNPCLDKEELRFSGLSRQAMEANIAAFSDLMYGFADGGERKGGFAALVRQRGNETVAARSETYSESLSKLFGEAPAEQTYPQIVQAQAAENCEVSQNGMLCRMRVLLKQIAADLKYEYTSILQVKVPAAPAGDND